MVIISLSNFKGGVGKTVATSNIAVGLNAKVLLVDLDPQSNLSYTWNRNAPLSLFDYFTENIELIDIITPTRLDNIDIVPAKIDIGELNQEILDISKFQEELNSLNYDIILIDTPPTTTVYTEIAALVSTHLLMPLTPSRYSIQGAYNVMPIIQRCNPKIKIIGGFWNIVQARRVIAEEIMQTDLSIHMLTTTIPMSTIVEQAEYEEKTVIEYSPHSKPGRAYKKLAKEVRNGV
jgi:chromosome partitioning protein